MQFNILLPALAALGGALIGALAPIVVGIVNARAEARRERMRLAVQLALEDHKHLMQDAAAVARRTGTPAGVAPIAAVLAYHADVLQVLHDNGEITPEDLVRLNKRAGAAYDALANEQNKGA